MAGYAAKGDVRGTGRIETGVNTKTSELNAVGLVALPDLADILRDSGYTIVGGGAVLQTAMKTVMSAIGEEPLPVLVSNVGVASLLRTWTRRAVADNDGQKVVVVAFESGYQDHFPDGVTVVSAPCSVADVLSAAGVPVLDDGLGSLVLGGSGGVDLDASLDTEMPSGSRVRMPDPETIADESPRAPMVPVFESDDVDDDDDDDDVVLPPSPAGEPVAFEDVQVPEVPSFDAIADDDDVDEDVEDVLPVAPTSSGRPVPAHVREAALLSPGSWVFEYDNPAEAHPDGVIGAWWVEADGTVDEQSFEANNTYVPRNQSPTPPAPTFDTPTVEEHPLEEVTAPAPTEVKAKAPSIAVPPPVAIPVLPEPAEPVAPVVPDVVPVTEPVAPIVTASDDATPTILGDDNDQVRPAPNLLAEQSNRGRLSERFEPTSLTADDNPLTMSQRDDSYLDVSKRPHGRGDVVFSIGAKGGVGKTTNAINLAQRAAAQGLHVVLVDGNFGQGDIREYLRLSKADIPSIYDAAISRNLRDAYIGPDVINANRPDGLDDIKFVYVAAPPEHLADVRVITPELYAAVIAEATHFADLIIVDTQIIETVDATGMVDRLIIPMLQDRAWAVTVTDLSRAGIANTIKRLDRLAGDGVPSARVMSLLNRVPRSSEFDQNALAVAFSKHSKFLGTVFYDEEIGNNMTVGRTAAETPALYPMLDVILTSITGQQPPTVELPTRPVQQPKPKRRLFGRWKGNR